MAASGSTQLVVWLKVEVMWCVCGRRHGVPVDAGVCVSFSTTLQQK